LGGLLGHRRRIVQPAARQNGRLAPVAMRAALRRVLDAAGNRPIVLLLDGNVPIEQMAAAAAWCAAWEQARLCLVIEPGDEQMLRGVEAGGAEYLREDALGECDGFVVVGDALAANPICARAMLDRRRAEPKTPLVVVDPGAGAAAKFATHRVDVAAGMELAAVAALAAAAGVGVEVPARVPAAEMPSAVAAGEAVAACRRLGVLVAAEHARTGAWGQIGYIASRLAEAKGGGVAPQPAGANALAAVRLAGRLGAIGLAEALAPSSPEGRAGAALRVAIGCDPAGMLGLASADVFAAAAGLPNVTAEAAEVVLPAALPGEYGGTFLLSGQRQVEVAALMPPPAGVPTPAALVAGLAGEAGVSPPLVSSELPDLSRLAEAAPAAPADAAPAGLLLGRSASHHGCGSLTRHAAWQAASQPVPELRMAPAEAAGRGLGNLSPVRVRADGRSASARLRTDPALAAGVMVLSDGFPASRALVPGRADVAGGRVVFSSVKVDVSGCDADDKASG